MWHISMYIKTGDFGPTYGSLGSYVMSHPINDIERIWGHETLSLVRKIQITVVSEVIDAQDKVREWLKKVRYMLCRCQLNELASMVCKHIRIRDREESMGKSKGWE
jgi:hypothetical protein